MLRKLCSARGRLKNWVIKQSVPITRFIGKLHAPFTHKRMNGLHYYDLRSKIKVGQVLLTRTRGEFTNLVIPGRWTHTAIYVGDETVVEAVGDGVRTIDLVSFMLSKDEVIVFESLFATPDQKVGAAKWALDQVGKPYDYHFMSDNQAFYCSELIAMSYLNSVGVGCAFVPRQRFGSMTVTPQDFADAKAKWSEFWRS